LLQHPQLRLEPLDLADAEGCLRLVRSSKPQEVYNLGGVSFIGHSFSHPVTTAQTTGLGALNLLEAIRVADPQIRFFQASSSEMFGNADVSPQNEETPFHPRSPYAVAKLFAHWSTVTYRESYGIFACSGILFNHESPLRSIQFVTRKIADAVARMRLGQQEVLELGNLEATRDWGYAPEYVDAMWRMLQTESPGTYVLATGRLTTVRRFVEAAFRTIGTELRWQGRGCSETGVEAATGRLRVRVSSEFFRPSEPRPLCGDPAKAERLLGWKALLGVDEICRLMVEADLERLGGGVN
jgi:GDPmannose 4,6-dehydratase